MVLPFHLNFFRDFIPHIAANVNLSIFYECNKRHSSKIIYFNGLTAQPWFSTSSHSFHLCVPSCESCWRELGNVCSVCACQQLWLSWFCEGKTGALGPTLIFQYLIIDVCEVQLFSNLNGLNVYCNSERTIPGNSEMFGERAAPLRSY